MVRVEKPGRTGFFGRLLDFFGITILRAPPKDSFASITKDEIIEDDPPRCYL